MSEPDDTVIDARRGFVIRQPQPWFGTSDDDAVHIVLVHPEIPGNTGSIGRLCAATGAWLHLVRPLGFELDDRYLKRAGLDYWPHVSLCVHDSFADVEALFGLGRMTLFTKKSASVYTEVSYAPGCVLVFGCETRGLPDDLLARAADQTAQIPIHSDRVRSINLANAAAVGLYEALRQMGWVPA